MYICYLKIFDIMGFVSVQVCWRHVVWFILNAFCMVYITVSCNTIQLFNSIFLSVLHFIWRYQNMPIFLLPLSLLILNALIELFRGQLLLLRMSCKCTHSTEHLKSFFILFIWPLQDGTCFVYLLSLSVWSSKWQIFVSCADYFLHIILLVFIVHFNL